MTSREAGMIAKELYKLIHKDVERLILSAVEYETEELLTTKQAAEFMGVSSSYILHNIDSIPHIKVGRLNKFKKSSLNKLIER